MSQGMLTSISGCDISERMTSTAWSSRSPSLTARKSAVADELEGESRLTSRREHWRINSMARICLMQAAKARSVRGWRRGKESDENDGSLSSKVGSERASIRFEVALPSTSSLVIVLNFA